MARLIPPDDFTEDTLELGGAVYEKDGNGDFQVDLAEHVDILKAKGFTVGEPPPEPAPEAVAAAEKAAAAEAAGEAEKPTPEKDEAESKRRR